MFILKRNEDGAYVARPGSSGSYTGRLEEAQVFTSRTAAEANKCGNETAYPVETCLSGARY